VTLSNIPKRHPRREAGPQSQGPHAGRPAAEGDTLRPIIIAAIAVWAMYFLVVVGCCRAAKQGDAS